MTNSSYSTGAIINYSKQMTKRNQTITYVFRRLITRRRFRRTSANAELPNTVSKYQELDLGGSKAAKSR